MIARARRLLALVAAILALLATAYLLAAWIGSSIPRDRDVIPAAADGRTPGIGIMVESNGFHTAIVVPVAGGGQDWRGVFPEATGPRAGDGRTPTHLAISWGEREAFLNLATLADLELMVALRIAFKGGGALLRVSDYVDPRPGPNMRPLRISLAQYALLARRIEGSIAPHAGHGPHNLRATYSDDAFYPAHGRYTIFYTCNNWVADTLAHARIRMGRWTPFAGGVMKWIPRPDAGAG